MTRSLIANVSGLVLLVIAAVVIGRSAYALSPDFAWLLAGVATGVGGLALALIAPDDTEES